MRKFGADISAHQNNYRIPINNEKLWVSITNIKLKEHYKYAYKEFAYFAGITCYRNKFQCGSLYVADGCNYFCYIEYALGLLLYEDSKCLL
jgi:hypothetical protein